MEDHAPEFAAPFRDLGIAFGVACVRAHLSWAQALAFSSLVFTGGTQFAGKEVDQGQIGERAGTCVRYIEGGFAVDFTTAATDALQRFADAGMHLVRSTDPLAAWPGIA